MVDVDQLSSHCGRFDSPACSCRNTPNYVLRSAHLPPVAEGLLCGWRRLDSRVVCDIPKFSFQHSHHGDWSCEHRTHEYRPHNTGELTRLELDLYIFNQHNYVLFQCIRKYEFGAGEKELFGAEMMRLGRKYVKAMNSVERRILLHRSLYYHIFNLASDFELAVDGIVKLWVNCMLWPYSDE